MSHHQQSHTLERDALGRLVFIDAAGTRYIGVYPVRAFPITSPGTGISIMDQSGKELCWFDDITAISEGELALIEEELAAKDGKEYRGVSVGEMKAEFPDLQKADYFNSSILTAVREYFEGKEALRLRKSQLGRRGAGRLPGSFQ